LAEAACLQAIPPPVFMMCKGSATAWLLASSLWPVTTAANQVAVNTSDAISNLPDSEPYDATSAISTDAVGYNGFGAPSGPGYGPPAAYGAPEGKPARHTEQAGQDAADRKVKTTQDKPESDNRGQNQKGNIRGTISMKAQSLQRSEKERERASGGEPARHTEQAGQDPADRKGTTTQDKPESDQKMARKKGQEEEKRETVRPEDHVQRSPVTTKKTPIAAKKGIAIQAGAVEPQAQGKEFVVAFVAALFISAAAVSFFTKRSSPAEADNSGYLRLVSSSAEEDVEKKWLEAEAQAKKAAEEKKRLEAEGKAKAEEEKKRLEAEAKAKAEEEKRKVDDKAKKDAEEKRIAEDAKAKQVAEEAAARAVAASKQWQFQLSPRQYQP